MTDDERKFNSDMEDFLDELVNGLAIYMNGAKARQLYHRANKLLFLRDATHETPKFNDWAEVVAVQLSQKICPKGTIVGPAPPPGLLKEPQRVFEMGLSEMNEHIASCPDCQKKLRDSGMDLPTFKKQKEYLH